MTLNKIASKVTIKDEILCDIERIEQITSQIRENKARVSAVRDLLAKIKALLSYSNNITDKLYPTRKVLFQFGKDPQCLNAKECMSAMPCDKCEFREPVEKGAST